MSDTIVDMLRDRVDDVLSQRKLSRMFDRFVDVVADKALKIDRAELRGLEENERAAAILAVAETFDAVPVDRPVLFGANLDPRALEKHLRAGTRSLVGRWALSDQGTALYDLVLRESCAYLLEITTGLPQFMPEALTEILRRLDTIARGVVEALDRMPARTSMAGDEGFATDYRRQVAKELDFMDLFGANVFERARGYQLSVAYISLAVIDARQSAARSAVRPRRERDPMMIARAAERTLLAGDPHMLQGVAVDTVLANTTRVFIRGEAGSGKTTLLQWLAVTAARQSFAEHMADWNGLIPFFIRLRRFASTASLPQPEQFLDGDIAGSLAAVMPEGWVHRLLQEGRAVVLVDGVDELPAHRRRDAQDWLRGLINAFPKARYVVTSRPAAAQATWLAQQEFGTYIIQPMTLPDVRQFIGHWHAAVREMVVERAAKDEVDGLAEALIDRVFAHRDLRLLATNPLMCALICALNRERRTRLPSNRIELFRIALEMFLDRRDAERGLERDALTLEFADKQRILRDLSYWMMTNGLASAERDRVIAQIAERLRTRSHRVTASAEDVLGYLLERSGLIREPVVGWIDFVHRSFQEYLAAQAAVEADHIEALIGRTPDDQWRQVVVLAAGLTSPDQSKRLFNGLLEPPRKLRDKQMLLDLVALACLETAGDVEDRVRSQITARVQPLIPPRSMDAVLALGQAGEFTLDLLADLNIDRKDKEAAVYSTRLAANIGGPAGLRFIERVAADTELIGSNVLVSYWDEFEPIEYAQRILKDRTINLDSSGVAVP